MGDVVYERTILISVLLLILFYFLDFSVRTRKDDIRGRLNEKVVGRGGVYL